MDRSTGRMFGSEPPDDDDRFSGGDGSGGWLFGLAIIAFIALIVIVASVVMIRGG